MLDDAALTPVAPRSVASAVQAHMTVHDAAAAIGFYVKAFGAEELFRLVEPAGRVGHAEIRIGDTVLMMNDEYPDFGASSPAAIGGSPVAFRVLVPDADKAVELLGELSQLAKEVEAELQRARRDAEARPR